MERELSYSERTFPLTDEGRQEVIDLLESLPDFIKEDCLARWDEPFWKFHVNWRTLIRKKYGLKRSASLTPEASREAQVIIKVGRRLVELFREVPMSDRKDLPERIVRLGTGFQKSYWY